MNVQDNNIKWLHIYVIPYISTSDIYLQKNIYKIIMGILPTNSLLVKYKITNDSVCAFCNDNEEMLCHLF